MANLRSSNLSELRHEMTNTFNRLHSINQDSLFVNKVAQSGTLPVIPNLRCGAWYVDPSLIPSEGNTSAYFKSTDGHTSQWDFNLRRANLHLLSLIEPHGGIILVDSTRRGKRHPDALSRTVPIWCAVINRALGLENEHSGLFTPPDSVSPSEHAQMEAKIDEWANLLNTSAYTLPTLKRPLRPFWISPDSSNPQVPVISESTPFYAIVCLSASQRVQDGVDRRLGFTYVQGSGDDHEMWSQGLTPSLFWQHESELLACSQEDLPGLIEELLDRSRDAADTTAILYPINEIRGRLLVGSWAASRIVHQDDRTACATIILADAKTTTTGPPTTERNDNSGSPVPEHLLSPVLRIPGYYPKQHPTQFLTQTLPQSLKFIRSQLATSSDSRIAILCKDAKDLSVGVATTALALYFDDTGNFIPTGPDTASGAKPVEMTKDSIKRRLQWVLSSCPGANPARATLKRINEYLMSPNRPSLQVLAG